MPKGVSAVHIHRQRCCEHCGKSFADVKINLSRRRFCGNECHRAWRRAKGPEAFWAKVDKSAGQDECWLYMGFRKWDGYGWLARSKGNAQYHYVTAHRYAWILTHGEPTNGLHVLHRCDNPPCCNPAHLWLGTHADNMADRSRKGRALNGVKLFPDRVRPERKAPLCGASKPSD
jgi:hypothetical protein